MRETTVTTGKHTEVLTEAPKTIAEHARPVPGPIAILPAVKPGESADARAVYEAGGAVAPLSEETRGLIYTTTHDVTTLVTTLEQYPKIGWVQLPFAGIDAYGSAIAAAAERGVIFTSAKGAFAQPVAEHALMLTLALTRQIPMRLRATSWGTRSGQSLYGANVVIVGAGGIAQEYLRLLEPFGATTRIVRRRAEPVAGADATVTTAALEDILPEADVVMLAAASTDGTRSLINASRLERMKSTAVLVNIARGALIDTDALLNALDNGELYGAGLDVTDPEPLPSGHPLYSHERCIITPHTADTDEIVRPLLDKRIRDNVHAFLETGNFIGVADPHIGY